MEAGDVLADQLHGRPAALELLVVDAVSDGGDVVEQGLEPHVDDVRVIPGHLDAPVEARTRDRQVGEPLLDELDDLVADALRLHEVGLGVVEVEQLLLELAHAEEVVLLLQDLDRARVDLADQLARVVADLGELEVVELLVLLAADAVVALVLARVDEAVVVELLQEHRDGLLVARLGGADEVVVRDVDRVEQGLPGALDQLVGPLLRLDPVGDRGAQDLLAVLVGAGQQPGVVARLTVPAGEHVGRDLGVGVTDVRHIVDVENGRRDVERPGRRHGVESNERRRTLPARWPGTRGQHGAVVDRR